MKSQKIVIICRRKLSDALLCKTIESDFETSIIHYQIPVTNWVSWLWRRIRKRGLLTLVGNLELLAFIKIHQKLERFLGMPLWKTYVEVTPSWKDIKSKRTTALSENHLMRLSKDADIIILLDNCRLSHHFFRKSNAIILQVAWGGSEDFLGDSGAYWSYIHDRSAGSMIIRREEHFIASKIIARIPTPDLSNRESIRSLKIKQVLSLTKSIREILTSELVSETSPVRSIGELSPRFFYAPTLYTVLTHRTKLLNKFPSYAFRIHK